MKKQGFTLVELMVAVVIMGVIASVAVPKLANHVASAKASEIVPAAISYTKLQSAYLYENKAFGTWKKIGYEAPGGKKARTENFKYGKGDVTKVIKASSILSNFSDDGKTVWQAENLVGMGNCHQGNQWKIKVLALSENEIEYRPYLEPSETSSACKTLAKDWGSFQALASLDRPPSSDPSGIKKPSSSESSTIPSETHPSSSETVVAGGSTPTSSATKPTSSSSETKVPFYDEDENFTDEDDGSCGVMYTSKGDRCPPSWCKLNGNVSRNHGGWGNKGHKWNECYAARQELISIASDAGQVNCKNKNVCKVTDEGKELVINNFTFNGTTFKGLVISRADEEITDTEYESGMFSSSSAAALVYNGKGRENAEQALGEAVMCTTDNNDASCKQWRPASECTYPNRDNTSCISW